MAEWTPCLELALMLPTSILVLRDGLLVVESNVMDQVSAGFCCGLLLSSYDAALRHHLVRRLGLPLRHRATHLSGGLGQQLSFVRSAEHQSACSCSTSPPQVWIRELGDFSLLWSPNRPRVAAAWSFPHTSSVNCSRWWMRSSS